MENPLEMAQLEMQQKLGRCMLRFQQYERMLKTMVATATVKGAPENLNDVLEKKMVDVSMMTLGTLLGLFNRGCVDDRKVKDCFLDDVVEVASAPSFKMQFAMSMSTERCKHVSAGLNELKDMRNELVHHLIERFDISSEADCMAASRYLDDCYAKTDDHLRQLKEWADGQVKAHALAASFVQSTEFENAFVHGINPDGTVCWPRSTVVEHLRDAEKACGVDGWTSLDTAIAFIMRKHCDQSPTLYGCKTWREVLMKSELFEFRRSSGSAAMRGQTWYRSREYSPDSC